MSHVILWNSSKNIPVRPLGAHQLASWLRGNGYVVDVIDFCNFIDTNSLVAMTEAFVVKETIAIGVSSTFWINENWPPAKDFVEIEPAWVNSARQKLEDRYPNLKWCMGGSNSHKFSDSRWVRFSGVSENNFLLWLDTEAKGTFIKRNAFSIKQMTREYTRQDLIRSEEVIPIELGRGCMFKCRFCSYELIGKKPGSYLRNIECIRDEILHHYENWGVTKFYYVDNTVNESKEKVALLAEMAKSLPFKIQWIGYNRADLIWAAPATSSLLEQSGLVSAFFGIESFERQSSQLLGKAWSGMHGKDWLIKQKKRWSTKITWQVSFVVGVPGQTEGQLESDLAWLIENEMWDWNFYPLWLEPGNYESEFSSNSLKYGFTFPDCSRPWYWECGEWNFERAYSCYKSLETMSIKKRRIAGWALGEVASLGYSFDDLTGRIYEDLPWLEIQDRSRLFLQTYIKNRCK